MGSKWQEVKVEVLLAPGLPQIQYLGLADRTIREGALRVKTALRRSGFEFPTSQQVIVNISPSSVEKSSSGIDLAVAAGFLLETGQISWTDTESIIFGELGINGDVKLPIDFVDASVLHGKKFLGPESFSFNGHEARVSSLQDLKAEPDFKSALKQPVISKSQNLGKILFSGKQKEWLVMQNLGEFHSLLAGSQGAGKSTLVKALPLFLEPREHEARKIFSPHHSITTTAFIGGGTVPQAGEIARAHGGILFLDEFLEFESDLLEALRRPFEEGHIEISRLDSQALFPCETIIVAATNLCPCGKWVPGSSRNCSYSRQRCLKPVHRLSGPLLDRFQTILIFDSKQQEHQFSEADIKSEITKCRHWLDQQDIKLQKALRLWTLDDFSTIEISLLDEYLGQRLISQRRRLSTLKVAKALQWRNRSSEFQEEHIAEAVKWSLDPFERMESTIY